MGRLFLLRHAKAEWAEPGQRDFDRVLARSGVEDARAMGRLMASRGLIPASIICSSAARARQTLDAILETSGIAARPVYDGDLYATDAPGYLEVAARSGESGDLMLVGHNPMLEDVAIALARHGESDLIDAIHQGFATAGLAVITFDGPHAGIEKAHGTLEHYITPSDAAQPG